MFIGEEADVIEQITNFWLENESEQDEKMKADVHKTMGHNVAIIGQYCEYFTTELKKQMETGLSSELCKKVQST